MMGFAISFASVFGRMLWSTRLKLLDLLVLLVSLYILQRLSNQLSSFSAITKEFLIDGPNRNHLQMSQNSPILLSKTNRDVWMVLIDNDYVSNTIRTTGEWEPETSTYLEKHVKEGEIVIEAGANIGYYTALLGKLVGASGQVYSFEANKETYELATLTLKMNDLQPHVHLQNLAVSNRNGLVNFTYQPIASARSHYINTGGSHILTKHTKQLSHSRSVQTTTLDSALPSVTNVSWLRMDIEGAEIIAIEGAQRIIQHSPRIKIVMEWNRLYLEAFSDVNRFIDRMHQNGFQFYYLSSTEDNQHPISKEMLLSMGQTDKDLLLMRGSAEAL